MERVDFSWLGLRSAWCICGLLSCWYVGSLYVLIPKHLRVLERRNPRQGSCLTGYDSAFVFFPDSLEYSLLLSKIRARNICALFSCVISYVTLVFLAKPSGGPNAAPMYMWIGLWWRWGAFTVVARATLLTMSVYLGSIIVNTLLTFKLMRCEVNYMGEERMIAPNKRRSFFSLAASSILEKTLIANNPWAAFRNLIIGPVSEEVVFRGVFLPLLVSNGSSILQIMSLSPMLFGASHIHHLYDSLRHGCSLTQALVAVFIQLAYTSIFGAYVSFLFLRGGHIAAAIVAHIMCNFMGFPNFRFSVPPNASRLELTSPISILYPFATLLWTSYAVGIVIFFLLLFPLTEDLAERSHLWHVIQSRDR